jgi:predicted DNA-binding transcriptional regulator YafY
MTTIDQAGMGQTLRILYRNYRGETSSRTVLPKRIWFGATEWHPEPQWLMDATDLEKDSERSFAMQDILQIERGTTTGDVSD